MTVAQLLEYLGKMPKDAVVLIESGVALASIGSLEFVEGQGPGAPAEVLLVPSCEE